MSRLRGLFVTGTDTGVGKTFVTAAIGAALRADGFQVGVWKPVQSGVALGGGESDAERLLRYAGIDDRPEQVASYSFEAPLAPYLAAQLAGKRLSLQSLVAAGERLAGRYEAILVEGAGGVMVPLTEDAFVADLIARLRLPILIVARSGLGTVNHTLLTVSSLRCRGLSIAGVILNDGGEKALAEDDPSADMNAELIERCGKVKVLGRLPCLQSDPTPKSLAALMRAKMDLAPVKGAMRLAQFPEQTAVEGRSNDANIKP